MPDEKLIKLGMKMKNRRLDRHLTQENVSDASGVTVRTISKIERGEMNPSFEILSALVPVLGMSFDSLFVSEEDQQDEGVQELISLYKSSPKNGRHLIVETVRTLSNELTDICHE